MALKGLRTLNTAPSFSANFSRDFHDAVKLLRKGVFDQKPLLTHKFSYKDAETAFEIASEKPVDRIKGAITFQSLQTDNLVFVVFVSWLFSN